MAFWGVEVKPNKPYTHPSSKTSGRLRISQATLGLGLSAKKSVVQCNVGDKSPVLLCCLLPEKSEYCHLELEFEEEDDVVFSVIGPRSVHLTGYYLSTSRRHPAFGDSSESYGEDIGQSDSEKIKESSEEDDFEDSFINDGDVEYYQPSPSVGDEETKEELMDDKVDQGKKVGRRRRRLRKKFHISESEDDGLINQQQIANGDLAAQPHEDDEDKVPISSLIRSDKSGDQQKVMEDGVSKVAIDSHADHKVQNTEEPIGANDIADLSSKSEPVIPVASVAGPSYVDQQYEEKPDAKKKEKKKKGSTLSHDSKTEPETNESKFSGTITHTIDEQCSALAYDNGLALPHASAVASGAEQLCEVDPNAVEKEKKRENRGHILTHGSVYENSFCEAELQMDESKPNGTDINTTHRQRSVPENVIVLGIPCASVAVSSVEKQNKKEAKKKKKERKKANKGSTLSHDSDDEKNSCKTELQEDESNHDDPEKDIHMPNELCDAPANDKNLGGSVVPDSDERRPKRKRRKIKENKDAITVEKRPVSSKDEPMTTEIDKANPSEVTTVSNGIVVKELELGNPDGEVASSGKKVKIHYTGKLKEGGSVYDTSIGRSPLRFRLGKCDDVIDGLHLGLEGMRVGGKRRITVPPELGYGSEGYSDSIPPNAWLVLDVKLLRVR